MGSFFAPCSFIAAINVGMSLAGTDGLTTTRYDIVASCVTGATAIGISIAQIVHIGGTRTGPAARCRRARHHVRDDPALPEDCSASSALARAWNLLHEPGRAQEIEVHALVGLGHSLQEELV